ncbi:MAG: A/G-specific adenine glycosylase [Lachnospiraceae bacterium]|nr:A/G-specific adenine glycosylase [Lachnospiraceae bacterium]
MITDSIVLPLLTWYDQNKRILPWRENRDPYRIWVSEIMLQQTRVEAVKPYFDRFIRRLPDVESLATAPEEQLLKLWEGLGYYNRVKNMQKAARMIVEQYGGKMPGEYRILLELPGIGAYTAGAIASIAFNRPVTAVDGNVLRIITRLTADDTDVLSEKFKKQVQKELEKIVPAERPGDFTQALMELGATVCLPNGAPKCNQCPWRELCEARRQGRLDEIPYKKKKKARTIEPKTVLLLRDGDKTLIRRRPDKGLLAGLYEFPLFDGWLSSDEIRREAEKLGYHVLYMEQLPEAVHVFSHKEWHMKGYLIKVEEVGFSADADEKMKHSESFRQGSHLVTSEMIQTDYPIPSAFKAFTGYVNVALGNERFLR